MIGVRVRTHSPPSLCRDGFKLNDSALDGWRGGFIAQRIGGVFDRGLGTIAPCPGDSIAKWLRQQTPPRYTIAPIAPMATMAKTIVITMAIAVSLTTAVCRDMAAACSVEFKNYS